MPWLALEWLSLYQLYKQRASAHIYRKRSTIRPTLHLHLRCTQTHTWARSTRDVCRWDSASRLWFRCAFATESYAFETNAIQIVRCTASSIPFDRQKLTIWSACEWMQYAIVSNDRKWDIIAQMHVHSAKNRFSCIWNLLSFCSIRSLDLIKWKFSREKCVVVDVMSQAFVWYRGGGVVGCCDVYCSD